jgi:hypothetical protein
MIRGREREKERVKICSTGMRIGRKILHRVFFVNANTVIRFRFVDIALKTRIR